MSREEVPDPHITLSCKQVTVFALLSPSKTTANPKSPRVMRGFVSRDGSSSSMAPPSLPSRQPGHYHWSSPTSSDIHQQQAQPGYPTVPVASMDEHYSKHWRVDNGQSPRLGLWQSVCTGNLHRNTDDGSARDGNPGRGRGGRGQPSPVTGLNAFPKTGL